MNTTYTVHPKLQHFGLTTHNLDPMIDWYGKVLGMKVNHRSDRMRGPWKAVAFLSNDEVNHRIALFEIAAAGAEGETRARGQLQHIAFAYDTLDDLLGTYVRLKGLGIAPVMCADQGVHIVFYYMDPDQNRIEVNACNFGSEWTASEFVRASDPVIAFVDPDKLVLARKGGATPWEMHERALAGELSSGGFAGGPSSDEARRRADAPRG